MRFNRVPAMNRYDTSTTPSDSAPWQPQQAASYLGVALDTLRQWRQRGSPVRGPAFIRLGGRIRYLKADLDEWMRQNRVGGPAGRGTR